MKRLIIAVLATALSFSAFAQLPDVKVEDAKGRSFDFKSIVDGKKPTIISFWAMTCKPCIRELDALSEVYPDWKEEADFNVVAVSVDDSRFTVKAKSLAEGHGWTDFTLLYDKNQDLMRAMNVTLTPQVFIIDKDGKIIYSHTGYAPGSESELLEIIKKNQ